MKPELVEKIINLKLNQKGVIKYENLDIQIQNKNNKLICKPEKKILFTLLFDFVFLFSIYIFIQIIYFTGIISEEEVMVAYIIGGLLSSILVWIVLPILKTQFLNYRHKNTMKSFNNEYSNLKFKSDSNYSPIDLEALNKSNYNNSNESDIIIEKKQENLINKISHQDKIIQLKQIKDLLDNGIFTQEEFDNEKIKILDS